MLYPKLSTTNPLRQGGEYLYSYVHQFQLKEASVHIPSVNILLAVQVAASCKPLHCVYIYVGAVCAVMEPEAKRI